MSINAIEKILCEQKLSFKKCKTWVTDGFYREKKQIPEYYKTEFFSVIEMESSYLAACA